MSDRSDDLVQDFDAYYRIVDEPVMRDIEMAVIGSAYGASSYTTSQQADWLGDLLGLRPGMLLLDLGSGAGWPGLHLAHSRGCEVMLTDVPLEGLQRAERRRRADGVPGGVVAASAALLPFGDAAFDAAVSSDVLC